MATPQTKSKHALSHFRLEEIEITQWLVLEFLKNLSLVNDRSIAVLKEKEENFNAYKHCSRFWWEADLRLGCVVQAGLRTTATLSA